MSQLRDVGSNLLRGLKDWKWTRGEGLEGVDPRECPECPDNSLPPEEFAPDLEADVIDELPRDFWRSWITLCFVIFGFYVAVTILDGFNLFGFEMPEWASRILLLFLLLVVGPTLGSKLLRIVRDRLQKRRKDN